MVDSDGPENLYVTGLGGRTGSKQITAHIAELIDKHHPRLIILDSLNFTPCEAFGPFAFKLNQLGIKTETAIVIVSHCTTRSELAALDDFAAVVLEKVTNALADVFTELMHISVQMAEVQRRYDEEFKAEKPDAVMDELKLQASESN